MHRLDVVQHGRPLSIELGALWALKHMHLLLGQMGVKVDIEQGLLGKDCVAHHTLVNHLGLSRSKGRMLGADVALGTGGRFEGHGAAGALVEHLAMSCLNVGLDRVKAAKHHKTAGTPVSDASSEVQAGVLQVGLEGRLLGHPPTLGADVGGAGLVDALVGGSTAAVGEEHGGGTLHTRCVEGWFDLLEVSSHLCLVAELGVTLRTPVTAVLHRLRPLPQDRLQLLGDGAGGGGGWGR